MLAQVPKGSAEMVAATIRTIFAQSGPAQVREQLGVIAGMLGPPVPRVEAMLHDAAHDITAFAAFPSGTGRGSGPLTPRVAEQGDQAQTDVAGVFPNPEAAGTRRPTVIALLRRGRSPIIVDSEYEEAEGGRQAEDSCLGPG
ncbi:MAG: transposase [Trebonia sp.]